MLAPLITTTISYFVFSIESPSMLLLANSEDILGVAGLKIQFIFFFYCSSVANPFLTFAFLRLSNFHCRYAFAAVAPQPCCAILEQFPFHQQLKIRIIQKQNARAAAVLLQPIVKGQTSPVLLFGSVFL